MRQLPAEEDALTNHRSALMESLYALRAALHDLDRTNPEQRALYPEISARSSPFHPGDHPYLTVAVPASLVLPWREQPEPAKVVRTVQPIVYYPEPLVIRWRVDALHFWQPYFGVSKAYRGLLERLGAIDLAPYRNDEISFLPHQVDEVAAWLAGLLATGDEVPHYFWWPNASETLTAARRARGLCP